MYHAFRHSLANGWAALAALSLFVGWLTGYWTAGAAAALTSLCLLAIGLGRSQSWRLPLGWFLNRRVSGGPTVATSGEPAGKSDEVAENAAPGSLVEQMIHEGRVALLLRPQIAASLSAEDLQSAQQALDDAMAVVPEGEVALRPRCYDALDENAAERCGRLVHVEGLFLDRCAVTNRQYLDFVVGGGYEQMSLWDEAIWPAVLTFVDRTGQQGPRFWNDGRFLEGQANHPVVGICWYEACAYARWAGKRLPTDAEWVKAASWPVFADDDKPLQRRFPWGDSMDRRLTNIWGSGNDTTIPVDALPAGASASGALQLVGNVWEWTSTSFGAWEPAVRKIETDAPLKSIRGGAFDTYFETQVHSQFQSGAHPLERKHNIGFRCALGFCDIVNNTALRESRSANEAQANELVEVLA